MSKLSLAAILAVVFTPALARAQDDSSSSAAPGGSEPSATPAPPPEPTAPAEPAPLAQPAAPAIPARLKRLAGATWDPQLGLVTEGPVARPAADRIAPITTPVLEGMGSLNTTSLLLTVGNVSRDPGFDATADQPANIWQVGMRLRSDFRSTERPWGMWFSLAGSFEWGKTEPERTLLPERQTARVLAQGQLGFDWYFVRYLGLGPVVGYRYETWSIQFQDYVFDVHRTEPSDHGAEYGLHARLQTADKPDFAARAYVDWLVFQRSGSVAGATLSRLEAGVRAGSFLMCGFWQTRLSSQVARSRSGSFDDVAKSWIGTQPNASTLGFALGFLL